MYGNEVKWYTHYGYIWNPSDASFGDIELAVEGYTLFRKDRTRYGGGVCVCAESHSC